MLVCVCLKIISTTEILEHVNGHRILGEYPISSVAEQKLIIEQAIWMPV